MPEIKEFPKTRVASVVEVGAFSEAIQRGFAKLFAWLGEQHLPPAGASLAIFYDDPIKVPVEKLRSELCVPIDAKLKGSNGVEVKDIKKFKAATIVYQGEASITPAYNEVYEWLRAQGYTDNGAPLEVYLSMPGEELRAEVFVPITKAKKTAAKKPVAKKTVAKKPVKKPAAKKTVKK